MFEEIHLLALHSAAAKVAWKRFPFIHPTEHAMPRKQKNPAQARQPAYEQPADHRAKLKDVFPYPFPGGFTLRDEANAIVACAFRNGPLEDLHAGKYSELLEDRTLSRITD